MSKSKPLTAAIFLAVGVINGLLGAGGGTLLVPAMEKIMGFETHKAHATAIAVILPLSILSAVIYVWGVPVDWPVVLYVSAGGVLGGWLGARWLSKLTAGGLHKIFGAVLAAAALRMIWG